MGDRWGDAGPPDEAYSRISRDLAEVSRGVPAWLDGLPGRLTAAYSCRVRPLTAAEEQRVGGSGADGGYAVEPDDPSCTTVLVGRTEWQGGVGVVLGFGEVTTEGVPMCWCDACDEDVESVVERAEELLAVAVGGFREFRRPYRKRPLDLLLNGPWLQEGYEAAASREASASADVRGPLLDRTWGRWPSRRG